MERSLERENPVVKERHLRVRRALVDLILNRTHLETEAIQQRFCLPELLAGRLSRLAQRRLKRSDSGLYDPSVAALRSDPRSNSEDSDTAGSEDE